MDLPRRTNRPMVAALLLLCASPLLCNAQDDASPPPGPASGSDGGKYVDVRLRIGGGGFSDSRSPEDGLGGDQGAIDVKAARLPLTLTYSRESYTNSADPTEPYEIEDLYSVSLFYSDRLLSFERASYFVGGGLGRLKVPAGERSPGARISDDAYSLEAGINLVAWRGLGVYGTVKYLEAEKSMDGVKVVDFSETILLLGASFTFGL